jgi:hypothetical protein
MDAKKLAEYGLIIIVGYFVVSWLFGTLESGVRAFASVDLQPNTYAPPAFPGNWVYGSEWYPNSPVRYGPPVRRGGGGGYTGRKPGSGGY